MTHVLRARRLLTEEGWLDDHQLRIADGVIAAIEPIPAGVTERDAELLCPAYIDTHVHGGAGVDVMDDAPDVLDKLAMHKAREGVGSWLPTTVTTPLNTIHAALKRIVNVANAADLVRKCWGVISKDRTSRRRIKARIRRSCFASLKLPSWIS